VRQEKAMLLVELARHLAASAEGLTLDEMASALAVGRRTVERMRDALLSIFPQMEEVSDPPTKRFRIPSGLDGFIQAPTVDELVELSKAAQALQNHGATARAGALFSLERKIKASMRASAARRAAPDIEALVRAEAIAVQAGPQPYEDPGLVSMLREAIKALRVIRFEYDGGTTPGRTRDVVPYGITFGRSNYLVGAEVGTTNPRSYRLSRIAGLSLLDQCVPPPQDFDLRAHANRSFGVYQGELDRITLQVLPHAVPEALEWRFHSTQRLTPQDDGSLLVEFEATGMLELVWHLFTWADGIRVLEPQSLRETLVRLLREAANHHGGAASNSVVGGV